ncbi:MAG: hypothetical protein JNM93_08035 [Bacteriovoracaceae bacterium]|nr:hypothetical protein [Bacteriovoracaceae bacterium]
MIWLFLNLILFAQAQMPELPIDHNECSKYILIQDEIIALAERKALYAEAIKENDFKKYKEILWKTHDNRKNKPILNGFNVRADKFRAWLGSINNQSYIPSHYQYFERSFKTLYVIENLTYFTELKNPDEIKSLLEQADFWLEDYSRYHQKINDKIDEGFQARLQAPILEDLLKKVSYEDFLTVDYIKLELPFIHNGQLIIQEKTFAEKSVLRHYYKNIVQKTIEAIFPTNASVSSMLKNSEIHHILIEQASMRRRLTFLLDKLSDIPIHKRVPIQEQYIEKIKDSLSNPLLNPRSDAVAKTYKTELLSEVRAFFMRKKGKEREKQLVPNFLEYEAQENVKKVTISLKKYFIGLITLGIGASIYTAITSPFSDNEHVRKTQAVTINWINNTMLDLGLLTVDLKSCAEEYRKFNVDEVCFNKFIMAHLSYYHLLSVYDGYDLNNKNSYFYKRRKELAKIFIARRDKFGYGKIHQENSEYLYKNAYPSYLNEEFIQTMQQQFKDKPEVSKLARDYILSVQDAEADSVIIKSKDLLQKQVGDGYVYAVDLYLKEFPEMKKSLEDTGRDPGISKDLKEFMEKTEKPDGVVDALKDLEP